MSNFSIDSLALPTNSLSAVNAISVQNSLLTYSDATGSNNSYEIILTPNVTSYIKGMAVTFKANFDNTGAATLNINGLGNKTIKKKGFNNVEPYDILEGQIISVIYDGNNFQMINEPGKFEPLFVFITSSTYPANTSVSSRDAACQSEANAAGLSGTFKAWMSNGGNNNISSTQYRSYYRTDNKLVAYSWADLTDGTIANPINVAANGTTTYNESVWTGLNADGSISANNCNGWTSISNTYQGQIGNSSSTNTAWTNSNSAYNCGNANPGVVGIIDQNSGASCPSCFPGSTKGNSYTTYGYITVKRNMNINGQPKPCNDESYNCGSGGCYQCNGTVYTSNPYRHYCIQQP